MCTYAYRDNPRLMTYRTSLSRRDLVLGSTRVTASDVSKALGEAPSAYLRVALTPVERKIGTSAKATRISLRQAAALWTHIDLCRQVNNNVRSCGI
jgi:hypothetical protein